MAAPFTLAQLLTPLTELGLRAQFLSLLEREGLPAISEWSGAPSGIELTFVRMISQALAARVGADAPELQRLSSVAAGRFLLYGHGAWLDLYIAAFYRLARIAATSTTFHMTLGSTTSSPPYVLQPGDVVIQAPSGNLYKSAAGGTLEPGKTLDLPFVAEAPGSAYADNPLVVTFRLVTTFAGMTLAAGGGDFTGVVHGGESSGSVSPRRVDDAVTPTPHSFAIRIDSSGEAEGGPGSATWSLSVDGGAFAPRGDLFPTSGLAGGTAITALPGVTAPSFAAGDVFLFSTPGTPGYAQGSDEEQDADYVSRAQGRWTSLSDNVLDGLIVLWVRTAYPAANRITVQADPGVPGRIVVVVADAHGAVDIQTLGAIDAFIRPKLDPGDDIIVTSATALPIVTAGNVRVPRDRVPAVQVAAQAAWVSYLASVAEGSEVRIAKLVETLIDAGAVDAGDVTPLTLNGAAVDVVLGATQVPTDGNPGALAAALTWIAA